MWQEILKDLEAYMKNSIFYRIQAVRGILLLSTPPRGIPINFGWVWAAQGLLIWMTPYSRGKIEKLWKKNKSLILTP